MVQCCGQMMSSKRLLHVQKIWKMLIIVKSISLFGQLWLPQLIIEGRRQRCTWRSPRFLRFALNLKWGVTKLKNTHEHSFFFRFSWSSIPTLLIARDVLTSHGCLCTCGCWASFGLMTFSDFINISPSLTKRSCLVVCWPYRRWRTMPRPPKFSTMELNLLAQQLN